MLGVTLLENITLETDCKTYAVQQVLKKNGFNTETIKYIGLEDDVPIIHNERDENRLNKFKDFNKYIKFQMILCIKNMRLHRKLKECYDYIVLGSDQIWNFTFDKIFSDKALGDFCS